MKPVRVLLAHNFYQQPGGEDQVFAAEKALLQSHGHEVVEYTDSNDRLETMSRLSAARTTMWSDVSYRAVMDLVERYKPDVAHFHNTFLLMSPSVYYACQKRGVPVVQSLHNYRLFCPSAILYRDGKVCEDCLRKPVAWPGIYHHCYRNSRAQSALVALYLAVHHRLYRTWQKKVNVYIALSEFSRQKFIEGGLPAAKIIVKPNFVSGPVASPRPPANYVLYLGRLSAEKGIRTLISAWERQIEIPLKIVGDGPEREAVLSFAADKTQIDFLGYQDRNAARAILQSARLLVVPSVCYENFPVVIAEAFAHGIPVIASRLGAMAEVVQDGKTGVLFNPGDADDLAEKVKWLWQNPDVSAEMGRLARIEYERKYTPEQNYQLLMEIYSKALHGVS